MKYMPDDSLFKIVNTVYEVVPGILTEHGKTKKIHTLMWIVIVVCFFRIMDLKIIVIILYSLVCHVLWGHFHKCSGIVHLVCHLKDPNQSLPSLLRNILRTRSEGQNDLTVFLVPQIVSEMRLSVFCFCISL